VDDVNAVALQLSLRDPRFAFHQVLDAKVRSAMVMFLFRCVRSVEKSCVEAGRCSTDSGMSAGDGAAVNGDTPPTTS